MSFRNAIFVQLRLEGIEFQERLAQKRGEAGEVAIGADHDRKMAQREEIAHDRLIAIFSILSASDGCIAAKSEGYAKETVPQSLGV